MQFFVRGLQGQGTLVVQAGRDDTVGQVKSSLVREHAPGWAAEDLRMVYGGRDMDDGWALSSCGMGRNATLQVMGRLRGGGGDGGSTGAEDRDAYLKMYAADKPDKVNPLEELAARSKVCALSGEDLTEPVVADEMGNLFNKEAVIHALVHKTLPARLRYIKSLKDVVTLKLTKAEEKAAGATSIDRVGPTGDSKWICPISGQEFNGRFKFVVVRATGEVFSEKAVKQMGKGVLSDGDGAAGQKFDEAELTPVNPADEALVGKLWDSMMERRAVARAAKKDKKAGKRAARDAAAGDTGVAVDPAGKPPAHPDVELPGKGAKKDKGKRQGHEHLQQEQELARAKKYRAWDAVPDNSSKSVYASIFTSSTAGTREKETYGCRANSARGLSLQ